MEGQSSSHNNPMQLMLCGINDNTANDVFHVSEDVQSQHILVASERSWRQYDLPLHIPLWINQPQEASHNHVFLAESSAFLQGSNNPPEDMMLESLSSPASGAYSVSGLSDFQVDMPYNYPGQACGSTRSAEKDAWQLRHLMPQNQHMETKFMSTPHQIHAQSYPYRTQTSNGDGHNKVSRADISSTARVFSPQSPSQPRPSAMKPKANSITDRQRRMRIADRLNALQELLPNSAEGCQASILDDVIDHVKYLQLQIKDLCKSRLEGEPATEAIIFREGFGHYLCEKQMSNEPLEEMIGKLLELNPLQAIHLLEMKGLLLMPIEFTKGLV